MRILFNTMNLGKGGAERVISILSNEFVKDNNVKIVTHLNMPIEYTFSEKIEITSIEKKHRNSRLGKLLSRLSIMKLLRLKKEVLLFEPDVIISFLPEPSFRILFLKKINKKIFSIPTIVSVRNDPNVEYNNNLYKLIMKKLYPLANQLVLQTKDAKKYFVDNINYNGVIIHNPVDEKFLVERYDGIRKKKIVAVGRLELQKNFYNLIDAFKIVSKEKKDYILEIYGDGRLKEQLQKYIDENKLTNKILLMGKVNNIKEKIFDASVFALSSDYEGMPNSLLEAACLGVPCISTDCPCGGPKEILDNGKGGILVETNNPEKLANGLIRLINNKLEAEKYSKYCNNKKNNYSTEYIIEQWKKEINKL